MAEIPPAANNSCRYGTVSITLHWLAFADYRSLRDH